MFAAATVGTPKLISRRGEISFEIRLHAPS
jgi:hypothetical protein